MNLVYVALIHNDGEYEDYSEETLVIAAPDEKTALEICNTRLEDKHSRVFKWTFNSITQIQAYSDKSGILY